VALLVGEAPVDHPVGGLGEAVGHARVLARSPGEVPAVDQRVAEGDPERRPRLLHHAFLAERGEHVGAGAAEVGDRVVAHHPRRLRRGR
jgi:hypothetical protein